MRVPSCMVEFHVEIDVRARSFVLVRQRIFETDPIEPGHMSSESPIVTFPFASRMAHREGGKGSTGERTAECLRSCSKQQLKQIFAEGSAVVLSESCRLSYESAQPPKGSTTQRSVDRTQSFSYFYYEARVARQNT